jgi:subtilase family serine protease
MRGKMRRITPIALVALVVLVAGTTFYRLKGVRASSVTPPEPAPAYNADSSSTVADWQFMNAGSAPPNQAACNARGRRCFNPTSMAIAYNYAGLHASGTEGQGTTIAIVDSYGSLTIASDLNIFDTAFNLQHMCGEANYTCHSGDPKFSTLEVQGSPPTNPTPGGNGHGTGLENHDLWAIEVSLDVEWAHATAPMANIILVTTPTAETLGAQGFHDMMNAEQYVVDHHLAAVISQSFGSAEGAFGSNQSLLNLRYAFVDAQANHVTVLASSGDGGSANPQKQPPKNPVVIPYPSVGWPASDPLVTAVGGTYLCTDATATTGPASVDSTSPPSACQNNVSQREVGWIDSGGGYSTIFSRPDFQNTLPPGSTYVGSSAGAPGPNSNMRGVPDISYQASARTGVLVSDTVDGGWFIVGGTSCGSPQWAGLVAMADQIAHGAGHGDIGYMNPDLYQIASNSTDYANDFYDVTAGNNQANPSIPGYSNSTGWDAVTGLGSPNAANLLPALAALAP